MFPVRHFDDKSQDKAIECADNEETIPQKLCWVPDNNGSERDDDVRPAPGGERVQNSDNEETIPQKLWVPDNNGTEHGDDVRPAPRGERIQNSDRNIISVFKESSDRTDDNKSDKWKTFEKIARCVFSFLLFVFVLGTAIVSRVSFHFMIGNLNPPTNFTTINKIGGIKPTRIANETNVESLAVVNVSWIWATYIAVLSPYLYNMVHYLWIVCKKEDKILDDSEDNESKTKMNKDKSQEIQSNGKFGEQNTIRPQEDPEKYETPNCNGLNDEQHGRSPSTNRTNEREASLQENEADRLQQERENNRDQKESENSKSTYTNEITSEQTNDLADGESQGEQMESSNDANHGNSSSASRKIEQEENVKDLKESESNNSINENASEQNNSKADEAPPKSYKFYGIVTFFGVIYCMQPVVEIITVFCLLPTFDSCTASVVSVVMSLCFPSIKGVYKTYKTCKTCIKAWKNGFTFSNDENNAKTVKSKLFIVGLFLFLVSSILISECIGILTSKLDDYKIPISVFWCLFFLSFFLVSPVLSEWILPCYKVTTGQQKRYRLLGINSTTFTDKTRNRILIFFLSAKIVLSFVTLIVIFIVRSKGTAFECLCVLFYNSKTVTIYMLDENIILSSEFKYYHRHIFLVTIVCVVSAYMCFKSCFLACRTRIQWQCFSLPLFLNNISVPLILWTAAMYPEKWNTDVFDIVPNAWLQENVDYDMRTISLLITSGVALLFSLLFQTLVIWNKGTKMLQLDTLFSSPYYYGLCWDVSIILSRRPAKGNDRDCDVNRWSKPPFIYICATMWHEEEEEMKTLLKSIFRLHKNFIDAKKKKKLKNEKKKTNKTKEEDTKKPSDYYEFAVQIFFDDAFNKNGKTNEYVERFTKAMNEAWSSVFDIQTFPNVKKKRTPYGGRQEWNLKEKFTEKQENQELNYTEACKFELHLKHQNKVKKKKRWSQVMYLYYLLVFKLQGFFKENNIKSNDISDAEKCAQNTYILALDGDIDFKPNAIRLLLDCMENNTHVAAACGRLIPMGKGPVVWYQKFEYAASHWLQKSTEHVFGCVLCSPGCFSLFRASALMSTDIIKTYTREPKQASDYIQYDQGEDRWLSTLLLKKGFKLEYMAASDARTYVPEGFFELFKQRRRWSPSTLANLLDILWNMNLITKRNSSIRKLFLYYQIFLFASSIITPGTIFLMILGAIHIAFPPIPIWLSFLLNITPVGILMASCLLARDNTQLMVAGILSSVYSLVMVVVLVGLIVDAVNSEFCSVATYFFCYVVGIFVLSALMHPKEILNIFCGIIYFLSVPSTSMLMILYALGNLHVTAWGTREGLTSDKKNGTVHEEDENGCSCFGIRCSTSSTTAETKTRKQTRQSTQNRNSTASKQKKQISPDFNDIIDSEEKMFWDDLIKEHLKPTQSGKKTERKKNKEIETKLLDLRNRVYFAFFLINGIYITLVYVIEQINETNNGKFTVQIPCPNKDGVFDVDPISIIFTVTFGLVLFIQFFGMILHRFSTFIHIMAVTKVWKRENNVSEDTKKEATWRPAIRHILNMFSADKSTERTADVTMP